MFNFVTPNRLVKEYKNKAGYRLSLVEMSSDLLAVIYDIEGEIIKSRCYCLPHHPAARKGAELSAKRDFARVKDYLYKNFSSDPRLEELFNF